MLISRPLVVGDVEWGTIFTLEKAGDVFPTHSHSENDNHITLVAFGRLRCMGHPNHGGVEIEAAPGGTMIDWTPGEPHGFIALTDGATLVNLKKVR